jgi:hypothetical protein
MAHKLRDNVLGMCGLMLMFVPFMAWVFIFYAQFGHLNAHQNREQLARPKTYRLHVLLSRTALFLPIYTVLIYISVMEPSYFEGLQPLFAIVEGYSFYSMFAVIVTNLGGPSAAVKLMQNHPEQVPCCTWCPDSPTLFYSKVVSALKYFLFLRVPCIMIGSISYYHNLKIINVIMTLVTLGLLVNGVVSLVTFYENVMHTGLAHFSKVVVLKVSIGLIVVQGILEMFLEMGGVFDDMAADNGYSKDGTITRYYCFLILVEYVFFAAAVANFYTEDVAYLSFPNPLQSSSSLMADDKFLSPSEFLLDVLSFHDVFTTFPVDISESESRALASSGPGNTTLEMGSL